MSDAEKQALLKATAFIMRGLAFKGRFMTKADMVEVYTREELVEFDEALDIADAMVSGSDALDDYLRHVLMSTRKMLKEILSEGG